MIIEAYKRNYFDTAIADVYRAIRGGSLTSSFTLMFCIIDSLAIMQYGNEKRSFNKWINRWLLPLNILYTERDELLYALRCSLVHSYGVSNAQVKQKISFYLSHKGVGEHLIVYNRTSMKVTDAIDFLGGIMAIKLPEFLAETTIASFMFFDFLKTLPADSSIIDRMFNLLRLHFPNNPTEEQLKSIATKPYASMDQCLSVLDTESNASKDQLLQEIFRIPTLS